MVDPLDPADGPDASRKMTPGRSSPGLCRARTRGRELNLRAEIARTATRAAATALGGEFFGGIWFKIFSERGPSRIIPTP